MEFWFRKDIPLRIGATAGEDALKALQEGTLVGAVRINETQRDFRDDRINPGLYTLRFALQPQDGDHMGTSPVPYFVLLSEAAADKDIEGPKDHEAVVKLSQTKNHPPNLNLRAVDSADGEFPRTAEGFDDTKILEVKLTAKAEGAAESTPLVLGVVYEGHGEV